MIIGKRDFDVDNRTYIMGILNVTPDSFSDGGKWNRQDAAKARVEEMLEQGADVIDVGGESTRPGYTCISDEEEIRRVVPVIQMIRQYFDVPVSVDTYKSQVAEAAIAAGADMINDIWGLKYDSDMAEIIARNHKVCCLMHNREKADYQSFMTDMLQDLKETIKIAENGGIPRESIILDPGVGFGKTYEQNLEAINRLEELKNLGYPVLLGTSRKSVIGKTLDLAADQRAEGTLATTVIGVMKGAAFVRVHDIRENARAIKMSEAVLGR